MAKKGLIISPYLLHGLFEVDVSKINSREPLCYAYGELLARFRKDDALCKDMIKFIKKGLEDINEGKIEVTAEVYATAAGVYAGFKEYDEKNPKTKIMKQEKIKAGPKESRYFWVKKSYNVIGKSLLGLHFFMPMLVEEPIKRWAGKEI